MIEIMETLKSTMAITLLMVYVLIIAGICYFIKKKK